MILQNNSKKPIPVVKDGKDSKDAKVEFSIEPGVTALGPGRSKTFQDTLKGSATLRKLMEDGALVERKTEKAAKTSGAKVEAPAADPAKP